MSVPMALPNRCRSSCPIPSRPRSLSATVGQISSGRVRTPGSGWTASSSRIGLTETRAIMPAMTMRTRRPARTAEPLDLGPVDPSAFPDSETRRAVDGGAASERFHEVLAEGGTVLADGAMGTMLFASGLQFGDPPEVWNLTQPEVIRRIHRGYLDAGSRIVMTNTFGGNRLRLGLHNLDRRVPELNQTAAVLLRSEVDAMDGDGVALVAGDIGPTGAIMAPTGTLEYEEAVDVFAEQAAALVAGGVDLIWIETMSDLIEVKAAIEGVRRVAPGIALITTMTFDTRGSTMMGVSPEQAVVALSAWGADAIGGNCGNGPDELVGVMHRMRPAAPDVILVAKSNAGMPELIDMRAVYRADPDYMAHEAVEMRDAGATIVGGCCGTTPDHLRAMAGLLGVR